MYQNYYRFSTMPFQLTPDSRFYFGSQEHRKAMAFLEYGLSQQEGFVVITGEIGSGKTTLVEHLLSTLDAGDYVIARLVTTQLGGYDILYMIANAFGIAVDGIEKGALIARIRQFFSVLQSQRRRALVIVDEAQSLTTEAVEELRMLSNLALGPQAPFQGFFLGQPEFRLTLASPEMQQLRQRVIASCHLGALDSQDTRKYIEHRLTRAGWRGDPSFSDGAFQEIHRHSGGIPRRINALCSRLLLLGFLDERHAIDDSAVGRVAMEMAAEVGAFSSEQAISSDILALGISTEVAAPQISSDLTSARQQGGARVDEMLARLDHVERATERHGRVIARALDLVLQYLPEPTE